MTQRGLARFTTPRQPSSRGDKTSPSPGVPPALARFIGTRSPPTPGEACELCADPVPSEHRHVVDLERRSLLCSCRACALLFEFDGVHASAEPGAPPGRYRTVPDRYVRIAPVTLPPQAWAALQIPVGIVFVISNSLLGRTVAFYPSPGGATESELPLDAWDEIVAANPLLARVAPDVEAVLIRTDADEPQCHVVPVDRCYELVGALRLHWRGFDGGQEVREHIAAFFADVERRADR